MAVDKMISVFVIDWMLRMFECGLMVVSELVMGREMLLFVKDFMVGMIFNWVYYDIVEILLVLVRALKMIVFSVILVIEIRVWSSIG